MSAPKFGEWRTDLENAPDDETTLVLLWNGKEVTGGARFGSSWADWYHDMMHPQPTHWMPLPEAPE